MNEQTFYNQELLRAQAVIEKAERTGENIGAALRDHMVSQSIIKELMGEVLEYKPKSKKPTSEDIISGWAKENVGRAFTSDKLIEETGVSYSSTLKVLRDRRDLFHKVKRGHFIVRDKDAEMAEKEAK